MRRWLLPALVGILLAPLAGAQSGNGTGNHTFPSVPGAPADNNATAPDPNTGNNGQPVGPAESVESAPGITTGILVLAGTLAFAGVLGYLTVRYRQGK